MSVFLLLAVENTYTHFLPEPHGLEVEALCGRKEGRKKRKPSMPKGFQRGDHVTSPGRSEEGECAKSKTTTTG